MGRHRKPPSGPRLLHLPLYTVEVRYLHRDELGQIVTESVTSSWPCIDKDFAIAEFARLLKAGGINFSSGHWRLVLRDENAPSAVRR